ncbi:hypothetical protein AGMMS4956_10440 [Bacteroidia bacterium]|nr:hypothetical protein AGMMS4956_10440 [Bacteroidia bacterium]
MKHVFLSASVLFFLSACSPKEPARQVVDFTEQWQFTLAEGVADYSGKVADVSLWRTLNLPHDWSIESDFSADYPASPNGGALPGGVGWYRKDFVVDAADEGKQIYIDFDGVYRNSKVWINGHLLGERPYGYASFRYDLTPHIDFGAKNVIAVRVDNSAQPNSRWYSGSGIYRNVWLTVTDKLHVDHWGTYITTPVVANEKAEMNVLTRVRNSASTPQSIELISLLTDATGRQISQETKAVEIAGGDVAEVAQSINIPHPTLWSIENPYLYKVITRIKQNNKIVDEYATPVGIRSFSFDAEKGFFLNGKSVKIRGVCQHHDLGCLGSAINTRALERQLEILKAMGCNGIRTSHNLPAPELLDLCDKMGFIVMDEAFDMWRKQKTPFDYGKDFPEWYAKDLTDWVLRDRNHPSIFMWSIGNEILEQWTDINADTLNLQQANLMFNFASSLSDKDLHSKALHVNSLLAIKLADIVKKLDPTRPITSGNNEVEPHNHIIRSGAMDIVGFNYHENQWVDFPKTYPGQKYICSESTSALMSRGYYEMPSDSVMVRPFRWDLPFTKEGNQCSAYDNSRTPWGTTHELSWQLTKKMDFMAGLYIWTGFDYLGEPTPYWWPSRSSYFGIIDLAGFPKDVYYMYQSEWTDKDMLHVFPHWNWKAGDTIDIWAYYNNADEVELFLNEKSLGKKSKIEDKTTLDLNPLHVWWRVPYEKGRLKAISRKAGKTVLEKEIQTTGEPVSVRLTADRKRILADGKDLSFITVEALDINGLPVPVAINKIKFSIEGNGTIAGTDNGDPTDHLSLKAPERKLFNGKALVVVQSTGQAGNIVLKAQSEGLKEAKIKIKTK